MNAKSTNSRTRRWLKRAGFLILATILLAWITLHLTAPLWLPHAILAVPNTGRTIDPNEAADSALLESQGVTQSFRVDVDEAGTSLDVWIIDPDAAGDLRHTLLILHGLNDDKRSMAGIGRRYAREGFRTVLIDLCGHGRSSGQHAGFGALEGADVAAVIDALSERGLIVGHIGVFGVSYGGAVGIQAADRDSRIQAVVSVSTFFSMRAIVPVYVQKYLPVVGWTISQATIDDAIEKAGEIAGYDPADADTAAALRRLDMPVMLIHGEADSHIPVEHARSLKAAAPDPTQLLILPGETHHSILSGRSGDVIIKSALAYLRDTLDASSKAELKTSPASQCSQMKG